MGAQGSGWRCILSTDEWDLGRSLHTSVLFRVVVVGRRYHRMQMIIATQRRSLHFFICLCFDWWVK